MNSPDPKFEIVDTPEGPMTREVYEQRKANQPKNNTNEKMTTRLSLQRDLQSGKITEPEYMAGMANLSNHADPEKAAKQNLWGVDGIEKTMYERLVTKDWVQAHDDSVAVFESLERRFENAGPPIGPNQIKEMEGKALAAMIQAEKVGPEAVAKSRELWDAVQEYKYRAREHNAAKKLRG